MPQAGFFSSEGYPARYGKFLAFEPLDCILVLELTNRYILFENSAHRVGSLVIEGRIFWRVNPIAIKITAKGNISFCCFGNEGL